jgi:hypothetical protein
MTTLIRYILTVLTAASDHEQTLLGATKTGGLNNVVPIREQNILEIDFRLKFLIAATALMAHGAARGTNEMLPEMIYCAKAAVFAEVFTQSKLANKTNDESVEAAVTALNGMYADRVNEQDRKLLIPWAVMVDKLRGYRPSTGGALVANSCFNFLKNGKYLQMGSPSVIASVRTMLDSCESEPTADSVGQCIKKNYNALPLEDEK